jgi:hydrogenase maturation protease
MNHPSVLVIGYGNSIRGDDGIGPAVATQVEAWNLPQVKSLCLHQLTPEIAAELAIVKYAIFVDAAVHPQSLELSPIKPLNQTNLKWGHYCTPQSLLSLTQKLYETVPEAYLISVPGVNFELGEFLSATAEEGVHQALKKIYQLMSKFNN